MVDKSITEKKTAGHDASPVTTPLDNLRRELARGTAELAILSVVSTRRRYGYEILKLLQKTSEPALEIKEGTLYPLLHRLEDAGHLSGEWEAEGRSRPRKYYTITDAGRTHLALLRAEWGALIAAMQQLLKRFDEVDP